MALENKISILYKNPLGRIKPLKVTPVAPSPVVNRSNGNFPTGVLPNRGSLLSPNYATNSGISGNMQAGSLFISDQVGLSQTLPLELVPTGYFIGDYYESGYFE